MRAKKEQPLPRVSIARMFGRVICQVGAWDNQNPYSSYFFMRCRNER